MRNLKFFGGLFLVIIAIVGTVYLLNRPVFETVYYNREAMAEGSEWVEKTYSLAGLVEYIEANPEYVSVTSLNLLYPEQSIHYGDEQMRTLGATGHIVLVGAWMEARQEGIFPEDSTIALKDIEKYHLPNVSESAHRSAMSELEKFADNGTVLLEDVVKVMVEYVHLPSADFLYDLLGYDRIASFTERYFEDELETPLPWIGFYILAQPMLHGGETEEIIADLRGISSDSLQTKTLDRFDEYLHDESYRNQVNQSFSGDGHNLNFTEQRALYNSMPKGTTHSLARFAASVLESEFISEEVSRQLYDYLSWPLKEQSTDRHFERYGGLYENRMSLLGGIDMGESHYTGERYAQAILFDEMPIGLWMHMSSNFMNQDYQKRLMYDPELIRRSTAALQ